MLVGRSRESAHLAALLEQARHGAATSLVVRGEPGIGKSALLEDLLDGVGGETSSVQVLRTQGLEGEAPLAFAALHRFLRPVTRLRSALPGPQARALRVAFGEEDGPSVEPFLVAVAALSLLSMAAEESTLLCVVEDAHWLDSATTDVLLFCARRFGADRVLLVFSVRDAAGTTFRPDGIDELVLEGLNPDDARVLLAQRLGAAAPYVVERLIAETGGNPLALLELPVEFSADQVQGDASLPDQLRLSARVENAFLGRSRQLPARAQSVLLIAAADDTSDLSVLRSATTALGLDEADLETAVASGLLVTDARTVRFRHPLVRSAVYQASTGKHRRDTHGALAGALAESGDPDRATWHRAAAAERPDLEVVAALESVASRAERGGAYASALAALERAAALTNDTAQRAVLTFAAARNAWACGQAVRARTLATTARQSAEDRVLLADIARLQGRIEVNLGSASDAHRIFVEAAHAISDVDQGRALEMGVAAAIMRTYGADSGVAMGVGDIDITVTSNDTPRAACLKQMLVAMTQAAEGDLANAVSALDEALAAGSDVVDLDVLGNLGNAALQLGDETAQQHYYAATLSRARDAGDVMTVIYALHRLCFGYLVAGDWAATRSRAEEALALAESVGQPALKAPSLAWLTLLAALQGRDEYDTSLDALDKVVAAYPLGILADPVHDLIRWAKGAHANAAGDPVGALHHLSRLRLRALFRMAAVECIDSAIRAEEPDLARRWVEELAEFAEPTGRPWAFAAVAYGHAMTGDPRGSDPTAAFAEALDHHARAGRPYDEARTHLAYGEWLRRAQRRVDSREHLRQAVEMFADLDAAPLAQRASAELRASGETARKRDPSTLVDLTPMELKVAELVSQGLSNKEVAAQCWVSPRTVAFHLRNVFTKTGVTSRGELAHLDLS